MNNQDWVIARWREDRTKNDPPFYTVEMRHGRPHIWMSLNKNVGWYSVEITDGRLVELHSEGSGLDSQIEYVGTQLRRRIEEAMARRGVMT